MAVKPAPGETVETQTRTRVIPDGSKDGEKKPWQGMDPFDYLKSLSAEEWGKHDAYLYRYNSGGKKMAVEEYHQPIDEWQIKRAHGGGEMCLMVKRNGMLIINHDFFLEGDPIVGGRAANGGGAAPSFNDPLSRLIDVMDRRLAQMEAKLENATGAGTAVEAVRQALTLNGQVFSSGAEALRTTLNAPAAAAQPNPMDEMYRQLMTAMIAKLLNPADPIENFAKMAAAMKAIGFGGGDGGKTSMALELVRQLPTVTNNLVQGIQAWSMGEEARARSAALMRGAPPPINVAPNPPPPAPPAPAAPAAVPQAMTPAEAAATQVPQAEVPGMQVQPMPIETLEQMLCDIIRDTNLTVEQAATEACALIERSMPGMTDQMISRGEDFMLGLFQVRPVLQQVVNHPRLRQFVQKFIEIVKAAPIVQAPNPNAPVA